MTGREGVPEVECSVCTTLCCMAWHGIASSLFLSLFLSSLIHSFIHSIHSLYSFIRLSLLSLSLSPPLLLTLLHAQTHTLFLFLALTLDQDDGWSSSFFRNTPPPSHSPKHDPMRQGSMHCEHATILAARSNPLAKIDSSSFKAGPFYPIHFHFHFHIHTYTPSQPHTRDRTHQNDRQIGRQIDRQTGRRGEPSSAPFISFPAVGQGHETGKQEPAVC